MSLRLLVSRRVDDVAKVATITIKTGVDPGDPEYGPAAAIDDNPAKLFKIDSTTAEVLIAFPAAQPLEAIGLIHHTFDAGAALTLLGHPSDNWGAPDFSVALPVAAWQGAGVTRWPINVFADLTTIRPVFQYYLLRLTGNSQNFQIGQIVLIAPLRPLEIDRGLIERRSRLLIEQQTAWGVSTIYARATTRRRWTVAISLMDAADRAALRAQWDDVGGREYPWVFAPDLTQSDCALVRWATPDEEMIRILDGLSTWQAEIEEVSRGLRPGS